MKESQKNAGENRLSGKPESNRRRLERVLREMLSPEMFLCAAASAQAVEPPRLPYRRVIE